MSKELYFNDELRKCLNAAGLSDCGENDQWNYWYQRVHKAHDQAIDRVTEAQRAENAKLRMFINLKQTCWKYIGWCHSCPYNGIDEDHDDCNCTVWEEANSLARELGIEVTE